MVWAILLGKKREKRGFSVLQQRKKHNAAFVIIQ